MDIQSVLLGFLMRKSMTGYDLRKAFSMSFAFFSGLSYGAIYPALAKMEKKGLITKQVMIQDGSPNRKVYTVTDKGREAFLGALKSPIPPEQPKSAFLMRLFFFSHLAPEARRSLVSQHLQSIESLRAALDSVQPEVAKTADRFQYLCFEFGQRCVEDMARNLAQLSEALEGESDNRGRK